MGELKKYENRISSNETSWPSGEIHIVEPISQQDAEQLNHAGKEQVSLGSKDIRGFPVRDTEGIFESVNGAFHGGALFVNSFKCRVVTG